MNTSSYQREILKEAVTKLISKHKVGLDIFTRGGKSYIAMDIIEYMLARKQGKNKYALIIGPKSIVNNLENNVMKDFVYKDKLIFFNYEKLSRQITITQFLESKHLNRNDIEIIVMDEAHKAFGDVRRRTFLKDIEYINSKYLVAMTATPYSNISGVNSLDELVGANNVISYHYDKAIKDKVARKINYIPAVLSYDNSVLDKLMEIRKSCNDTDYLVQLLDRFEKLHNDLKSNESRAISSYITESVKLDSSNGARVFVFFSSIDRLEREKDVVIDSIVQSYKNWGNKEVKYRYMNFTSASSEDEVDNIINELAEKPLKNTIDIICTVQMGVMGIHPSNTHFALIMSATTSLQKLMQMIGRVTNLCEYDNTDTTVFDLKDSLKSIGRVRYNVNTKDLLKDLLNCMYTEEDNDLDSYSSLVNIKSSKRTNESLELLAKIKYVSDTVKEVDSILEYILSNLDSIDSKKHGNIIDYIKSRKLSVYRDYEKRGLFKIETSYKSLLNIIFGDSYDNDIKRTVKEKMRVLEHRVYILETYNSKQCNKIKQAYDICKDAKETKIKTPELVQDIIEPILMKESLTGIERIVKDFDIMELFSKPELEDINRRLIEYKKKEEEARAIEEEKRRKQEEAARLNAEEVKARMKKLREANKLKKQEELIKKKKRAYKK